MSENKTDRRNLLGGIGALLGLGAIGGAAKLLPSSTLGAGDPPTSNDSDDPAEIVRKLLAGANISRAEEMTACREIIGGMLKGESPGVVLEKLGIRPPPTFVEDQEYARHDENDNDLS